MRVSLTRASLAVTDDRGFGSPADRHDCASRAEDALVATRSTAALLRSTPPGRSPAMLRHIYVGVQRPYCLPMTSSPRNAGGPYWIPSAVLRECTSTRLAPRVHSLVPTNLQTISKVEKGVGRAANRWASMNLARLATVLWGLALAGGCLASLWSVGASCAPCTAAEGCVTGASVSLELSCGPSDLSRVQLTGSCASAASNAGPYGADSKWVGFTSYEAGACHFTLDFASGFTYSGDVTFTEANPGCGCPSYLAPSQGTFVVSNPNSTCPADAGVE